MATLKATIISLIATATDSEEARLIENAGLGCGDRAGLYEAGGHHGVFDEDALNDQFGTLALTRSCSSEKSKCR